MNKLLFIMLLNYDIVCELTGQDSLQLLDTFL